MDTDLAGRLRKLKDVKSYKEPLLEAVANSIQSISQFGQSGGRIDIFIEWQDVPDLFAEPGREKPFRAIKNIVIRDNGQGFNQENLKSFKRLDTTYKARDFGCLGIGRLLWLKVFSSVEVTSVCVDGQKKIRRSFVFDVANEVSNLKEELVDDCAPLETEVKLKNIRSDFQNRRSVDVESIAEVIFKHFLLLYVLGVVPAICVHDGEKKKNVNEIYTELLVGGTQTVDKFKIGDNEFELLQQKFNIPSTNKLSSGVYLCAGQRVVEKRKKGIDPRINETLTDADENRFLYVGLVKGEYLDAHVNPTRQTIVFPDRDLSEEDSDELCFDCVETELIQCVNKKVSSYLKDEFANLSAQSSKRLTHFVDDIAPEFKGFVNRCGGDLFVSSDKSDSQLWDYVHREFFNYEKKVRAEVDGLISLDWSEDEAEEKIRSIEERIAPISSHDLVRFSARRGYYLNMLKKAISLRDDGKYQKESAVHSLIFPMQRDSASSEGMSQQNLWLIDDRLTFSHYLSSDKSFSSIPITTIDGPQRMDLATLRLYGVGDSMTPGELTIIEFKRPGRNDYDSDNNPISQVLDYVEQLRAGRVRALDGTEISNAANLPIFCYVIAQFTENLKKQCRNSGLTHNAIGDYYFGTIYNVYFEIMNFNSLYKKARERNHALLKAAHINDF